MSRYWDDASRVRPERRCAVGYGGRHNANSSASPNDLAASKPRPDARRTHGLRHQKKGSRQPMPPPGLLRANTTRKHQASRRPSLYGRPDIEPTYSAISAGEECEALRSSHPLHLACRLACSVVSRPAMSFSVTAQPHHSGRTKHRYNSVAAGKMTCIVRKATSSRR